MRKEDCLFCKFKDKEYVIYEDDICYAIISRNPINKHHVMVIPKEHYTDLVELPDEIASHIFLVVKKISKAVRKSCKPDAITYTSDDDISRCGYNIIEHYKFHIIPRYKNDIHSINWGQLRSYESDETRSQFTKGIKKHL